MDIIHMAENGLLYVKKASLTYKILKYEFLCPQLGSNNFSAIFTYFKKKICIVVEKILLEALP